MDNKISYKQAGVNKEEGYKSVSLMKKAVQATHNESVLANLGSFGAMYELPRGYKKPVLISGADGVGTKIEIALNVKKLDTIGIDCVAMCVNDILCHGAKPLFFLDYIACSKLDANLSAQLVASMSSGLLEAGASLIGGETAEMPGFYQEGKYDIAGFCVGIVERDNILTSDKVKNGDVLIGLKSSGLHSNGYSLVRKLVTDYYQEFNGYPIYETLLTPTKIYVKQLLPLLADNLIHGMAHITGGGLIENVPRMLNDNLQAIIHKDKLPKVDIIEYLQDLGASDVYNTFNMGIGMVLAVSENRVEQVLSALNSDFKEDAIVIGNISLGIEDICIR